MQVSGNFASDSNWIRPLPIRMVLQWYRQCMEETGTECRFYEFWTTKGTVGTFVLIGVW